MSKTIHRHQALQPHNGSDSPMSFYFEQTDSVTLKICVSRKNPQRICAVSAIITPQIVGGMKGTGRGAGEKAKDQYLVIADNYFGLLSLPVII
ncbi:MAG: hypothetical protein U0103_02980 [Candidatus Obscuribacterales bacterium]